MDTQDIAGAPAPPGAQQIYETASQLHKQKRYEEIVSLCEQAESVGNYSADVAAVHSVALMKLMRADETIAFLQRMLYYFPYDARLHFNLGTAYQATFHRQEASNEFRIAKRLDPARVGRKVDRLVGLRIGIAAVSFAVFFAAFFFWPHTRWLIVGMIALLMALTVVAMVNAIKLRSTNRMLIDAGVFVLWIVLMIVVLTI